MPGKTNKIERIYIMHTVHLIIRLMAIFDVNQNKYLSQNLSQIFILI